MMLRSSEKHLAKDFITWMDANGSISLVLRKQESAVIGILGFFRSILSVFSHVKRPSQHPKNTNITNLFPVFGPFKPKKTQGFCCPVFGLFNIPKTPRLLPNRAYELFWVDVQRIGGDPRRHAVFGSWSHNKKCLIEELWIMKNTRKQLVLPKTMVFAH